jgi:hypothetical protein
MIAQAIEPVKAELSFLERWNQLSPTQKKCCALAMLAIEDAAPILIEEGGIEELMRGIAVFMHGEVLPAPIVRHLAEQAARLKAG